MVPESEVDVSDGAIMAVTGGPLLALTAWIVWLVTRMGARGRLGMNAAAGIRLPSTMRSEEAWVAGHRAALRPARWIGALGLVTAVLLTASAGLPQGDDPHPVTIALFTVGYFVIVMGGVVWASLAASRAAREANSQPPERAHGRAGPS